MNNEDFLVFREKFTQDRFSMCDRKAVGYTEGNDDRHWNFKAIGHEVGIPPEKVLAVYLLKHFHSIMHWLKTSEQSGEGITQTIADTENYLDLLIAYAQEDACANPWGVNTPGDVGYAEREKGHKDETSKLQ